MSKNIFCGSLAWATTSEGLEQAFSQFGTVTSAKVITDRETGRSKGFGFVTFATDAQCSAALANPSHMIDVSRVFITHHPRTTLNMMCGYFVSS